MNLKQFPKLISLAAASLALLSTACVSSLPAKAPTENVVIILVDDLGWRDLACMGSPVYETPHIDALAQSGTLFT